MVLDLGLAVLNFTNWGELGQRGSVGFLDQEASIPLWHPDSPFPSLVLTRLRQISGPPLAQTSNPLRTKILNVVVKKLGI